jgi:ATP-dependent Clp protease, protease subunit
MNNSSRRIFLLGEIDRESIGKIILQLLDLNDQSKEPILLLVDSSGGSVPAMLMLLDTMRMIESPVNVLVMGRAHSAAATLTILAEKGRRFSTVEATMMVHPVTTQTHGRVNEMQQFINYIAISESQQTQKILAASGIPKAQLEKLIPTEKIMSSAEALEYGFIDKIVTNLATDIPDYYPTTSGQEGACAS